MPERRKEIRLRNPDESGGENRDSCHGKKPGRHQTICKVCHHPNREVIEQDFLAWGNTTRIEGRWVERSESVNLNDLFDRMTTQELEAYAASVNYLDGSPPHR